MGGDISDCPECGEFKPGQYPLCRRCNAGVTASQSAHAPRGQQPIDQTGRTSNTRRPYDQHDGEDDQKAKDKRYWFNHQGNGICNYCGHRYPYDKLEMEHMIPKELGGPGPPAQYAVGLPDLQPEKGNFHRHRVSATERQPNPPRRTHTPRRPVDPVRLRDGSQGGRYRQQEPPLRQQLKADSLQEGEGGKAGSRAEASGLNAEGIVERAGNCYTLQPNGTVPPWTVRGPFYPAPVRRTREGYLGESRCPKIASMLFLKRILPA